MAAEATDHRSLRVRRRPDLIIAPPGPGRPDRHVIKDPLTSKFFYLSREEFALFELLDRDLTPAQWRETFERNFPPRQISSVELQRFLLRLHRDGLIIADSAGQGFELLERRERRRIELLARQPYKLLAWRLRGVSPKPVLDLLAPLASPLFSGGGVCLGLALAVVTFGGLLVHFDEVRRRIPDLQTFLIGPQLLWMFAVLGVIKTLHELGHAIVCRRFGGECSEIGLQFLFGAPCLYSNVSDAWLMPSRRARVAVSLGGMYVELWAATAAAWIWWFSEPGILNALALKVLIVCTVGTLAFNANPLVRADGYYVLSDWWRVPNLDARARGSLAAFGKWCCLGLRPRKRFVEEQIHAGLALFALASAVYRIAVVAALYITMRAALVAARLEIIPDVLLLLLAAGAATTAVTGIRSAISEARMRRTNYVPRLFALGLLGLALGASLVWIPLPQSVSAPALIEADATPVYVTSAGRLLEATTAGGRVQRGDAIGRLQNDALQLELTRLLAERDQQQLLLDQGAAASLDDPAGASVLPAIRETLRDLADRIAQVQRRIDELTLHAPLAGVVIPPPRKTSAASDGRLEAWTGTPLDAENIGGELKIGTLYCLIGDPRDCSATAVLDQSEVDLVRVGERVSVTVDRSMGSIAGTVAEIARLDLAEPPPHLAAAGLLPTRRDARGTLVPTRGAYAVRIHFERQAADGLLPGAVGRAKITVDSQPLATRWLRQLAATFRFGH